MSRKGPANKRQTPPDGNLFSTYSTSRLDVRTGSGRFTCEDLRRGCPGMAADGEPADYSFIKAAQVKDTGPGGSTAPAGARNASKPWPTRACVSNAL